MCKYCNSTEITVADKDILSSFENICGYNITLDSTLLLLNSNRSIQVKVAINYCPMCGREL